MNFIITTKCNKGCPYCFASEYRKKEKVNTDMTMETFEELISKIAPGDSIKLLGGEPTSHPDFPAFFERAIESDKDLTLISNFLFKEETLDIILKALKRKPIHFLVNSTDLDKMDRIETFAKNYNAIHQALYQIDSEELLSAGITFDNNKDWKYYVTYLDFISKHIHLESLRVSIPNPDKNKEDFFFINNKGLGKKFLASIRWCLDNGIVPNLDCIIYPCMFETKEEWKFIKRFLGNVRTQCGVDGSPSDVFPDKTMSFCYPVKEAIKIDSDKYEDSQEMNKDMLLRYQILESKMKKPEACETCKFKACGMCNGPCLAFYDLSQETSGINV